MRKFFFIVTMLFSMVASASTYPLTIVNNTPYSFDYIMTTTTLSAVAPNYAFPAYRQTSFDTVTPYSTVTFNDPGNAGLPFYMIPSSWYYYPVNWSSYSIVSGTSAYQRQGMNQKWASVKFNLHTGGGVSIMSGDIGPFQGAMSINNPTYNVTLTWITTGNAVTLYLS